MKKRINNGIFYVVISLVAIIGVSSVVMAYASNNTINVEGNYNNYEATGDAQEALGGFNSPDIYHDINIYGDLRFQDAGVISAPTSVYATTTLTFLDSGSTQWLSASGTTFMLPAVDEAGLTFKFQVNGDLDSGNVIIDSAEGDNIEGTLIVAGAVVDCDAEDQINFVTDGENLGDYVELTSDGTQWLIGDSGVLTSAKMTCTDPS